jgi:CheY-like chemotaxis protein
MDVHMPVMDGYEAATVICQTLPELRRPIIVALTASVLQTDRDRCLAVGMSDFLTKPVRIKDLQLLLERWYPAVVARHSDGEVQPHTGSLCSTVPAEEEIPVNMERLMEMCDHNPEMLREIVDLYYDQADTSLAKLGTAIEQQQFREIEAIAHKLAGSSATCGMVAMSKVLRQLETSARESRFETMPQLLNLAVNRLAQLRSRLAESMNVNCVKM